MHVQISHITTACITQFGEFPDIFNVTTLNLTVNNTTIYLKFSYNYLMTIILTIYIHVTTSTHITARFSSCNDISAWLDCLQQWAQ